MTPCLVFTTTAPTNPKGSTVPTPEGSGNAARWPDSAWVGIAVGRRVSVRSSAGVPGPTGGPAFRDVVGVLEQASAHSTSWLIRTRTGDVVTVDPARIVAAKIVPDLPVRLRSASDIDTATLEQVAAQAWQPLEDEQLGDWVLRAAVGYTGRANSVLPIGDPGRPLGDALAAVTRWYVARGLVPSIQVPLPLLSDLDTSLAERDWLAHRGASVMVSDLGPLQMTTQDASAGSAAASVEVAQTPDAAWLASFRYGQTPVPVAAVPIMTKAAHPIFVSARDASGQTVAIARGAVVGAWLGITAVEVSEQFRRRGLGRRVIGALADYAGGRGCRHTFLQVAPDNVGARTLYESLGFIEHHNYVYRRIDNPRR